MQDLAATFLDVAAVPAQDVPKSITTRSLLAMMRGRQPFTTNTNAQQQHRGPFQVVRSSLLGSWSLAVTLIEVNRTSFGNQHKDAFARALSAAAAPDTNDDKALGAGTYSSHSNSSGSGSGTARGRTSTYVGCRIDWLGSGEYKSGGWRRVAFLDVRSNEEIAVPGLPLRLSTVVGAPAPVVRTKAPLSRQLLEDECRSAALKAAAPPGPWPH
jgi:hypothetical protein